MSLSRNKKHFLFVFKKSKSLFNNPFARFYHNEKRSTDDAVLTKFREGKMLVKIIPDTDADNKYLYKHLYRENPWDDFLLQLKNYDYRPSLYPEVKNKLYQYDHLTGEISQKDDSVNTNASTRESSTSSISKFLHTPLFCLINSWNRTGLAFDIDNSNIKAMFTEEVLYYKKGTVSRSWVSANYEDVLAYKIHFEKNNISFKNIEAFKTYTNQDNQCGNEVLAQLKREGLSAVVADLTPGLGIYKAEYWKKDDRDVELTLNTARVRQADIKNQFGLELPIVMYNAKNKRIGLFDERDFKNKNVILEEVSFQVKKL